jgi:DNA-binding response OmpR family regulator
MFFLKSNDQLLLNNLKEILMANGYNITTDGHEKYYLSIDLSIQNSKIILKNNTEQVSVSIPTNQSLVVSCFKNFLSNFNVSFKDLHYYPIMQKLFYQEKTLNIANIQHQIMDLLFLYLNKGIDKKILYTKIWPRDKNIYYNKLDTHLTNLKNNLKKHLNYTIKISTNKSTIKMES